MCCTKKNKIKPKNQNAICLDLHLRFRSPPPDLLRCNHPSFAAAACLAKFSGLCAHACVLHSAREGVPELGALHTRGDAAVTDETDAEPLYTGRVLIRVPPNREDDLRDASPDISTN